MKSLTVLGARPSLGPLRAKLCILRHIIHYTLYMHTVYPETHYTLLYMHTVYPETHYTLYMHTVYPETHYTLYIIHAHCVS